RQYRIQIEPGKEPGNAWFDKGIPADVGGFTTASLAMTLRRWWRENWFQPIARVGNIGNYEYPLHPAAPLPKVDFSACQAISQSASPNDIASPAPEPARAA